MGGLKIKSRIVLISVLIITGILAYNISKVEFNYDFEEFFPVDDPETSFFEEHRHRFESDNDFVFIAFQNNPTIFDYDFLLKVSNFVDSLKQDSLVDDIQSLTHLKEYVKSPFSAMVFDKPYLNIEKDNDFIKDSSLIFRRPELIGFYINESASSTMIYVKHRPYLSKKKCDILKVSIDDLLKHFELNDFKYAGRTIGLNYYVNQMMSETVLFIGLSFVLVIIILIFTFKSIWGVWVPLTIVTCSMIWILGFMGIIGQPINLILTVLPSIIFVVAMSDVIHLVSKYMDELRLGKTRAQAILTAYREVGMATLLTSVTTAIGFLTLLTVNMQPVRNFGVFTAIGVMLAFILAYTLLPAILVLVKPPKISEKKITNNIWYKILHASFRMLIRKKKQILFAFIAVLIIAGYGFSKMEANYFLLEDLKPDSKLTEDYQFFDKEFMGLRPFELAVEAKGNHLITDYKTLQEMEKVQDYLERDYGLNHCFSLVSVLKIANRIEHGGQDKYYKLPSEQDLPKFIRQITKFDKDGVIRLLVDSTGRYGRISSKIGDIGLYAITDKNDSLNAFIKENINEDIVSTHITGTGHLLDRNMTSISRKLTLGLLIALFAVALLMGILYRSMRMVVIAIIPNVFPMLMLAAILGYAGINLTVSTAIIFTISFGIAVDDTIHFMSKFKLELNKGRTVLYALKRTYLSTGRAIVLTTLILCAGFVLLTCSDFLGTFYIGFLICATLVFALFADLFFLPVILLLFFKNKKN